MTIGPKTPALELSPLFEGISRFEVTRRGIEDLVNLLRDYQASFVESIRQLRTVPRSKRKQSAAPASSISSPSHLSQVEDQSTANDHWSIAAVGLFCLPSFSAESLLLHNAMTRLVTHCCNDR